MSAAVPLRADFDAEDLRRLARASRAAGRSRRLLVLAALYDSGRLGAQPWKIMSLGLRSWAYRL